MYDAGGSGRGLNLASCGMPAVELVRPTLDVHSGERYLHGDLCGDDSAVGSKDSGIMNGKARDTHLLAISLKQANVNLVNSDFLATNCKDFQSEVDYFSIRSIGGGKRTISCIELNRARLG